MREAQKELEQDGYFVDYKIRPRIVPKKYNVDFFGLFDLVCYKKGESIRWISIKGHAGAPRAHQKDIKNFVVSDGNQKEIWVYRSNKTVKKMIIGN